MYNMRLNQVAFSNALSNRPLVSVALVTDWFLACTVYILSSYLHIQNLCTYTHHWWLFLFYFVSCYSHRLCLEMSSLFLAICFWPICGDDDLPLFKMRIETSVFPLYYWGWIFRNPWGQARKGFLKGRGPWRVEPVTVSVEIAKKIAAVWGNSPRKVVIYTTRKRHELGLKHG